MKFNWHTIGGALVAGASWLAVNVNWGAVSHKAATVAGVAATLLVAISRPVVERANNKGE